jgi:hypothetical protein
MSEPPKWLREYMGARNRKRGLYLVVLVILLLYAEEVADNLGV